jgi:hypothetical protein
MRPLWMIALAVIAVSPPVFAQDVATQGSAAAIRKVVSGKTCVGEDVLKFGQSAPGLPGIFNRIGQPEGKYAIGYGTILILRSHKLHGHVASVSVGDHKLYMSTEMYQCEP